MLSVLRFMLATLLLVATAAAAQIALTQNNKERVPVYTAKVSASGADKQAHSLKVSMSNTHEALRQALAECEAERQAAMLETYCEPVTIDGEAVVTAASLRQEAAKAAQAKLSLFRYRSKRGTLYVFGSVHLMKRNAFPLHPKIMAAFAQSDALVLEVDLGALEPADVQQAFISRGRYAGQQTLSGSLSADTVALAKEVLARRGLNFNGMNKLRPWMFEQTLITQELQLYGFDPSAGVDHYFDQKARASNKRIMQLETLEQQLALMSSQSLAEQELSLRYALQTLRNGTMQGDLNALVIDWLEGDVDGLFATMSQPMEQYPELQRYMVKLFDERNVAMAEKISGWIAEGGNYFVIVGAGHLGGPNGIVNLLRAKGLSGEHLTR